MAKRKEPKQKRIDLLKQELMLINSNPELVKAHYKWTQKEYLEKLKSLEEEINLSKKGKYRRQKGGEYERNVAQKLYEALGVKLSRTPMSGGFQKNKAGNDFKGDITNLDDTIDFLLHIECKNQKAWSLPAWIRQSEEDCPKGRFSVVIFHRHQAIEDGKIVSRAEDYISLKLSDFLSIVDKSAIVKRKGEIANVRGSKDKPIGRKTISSKSIRRKCE